MQQYKCLSPLRDIRHTGALFIGDFAAFSTNLYNQISVLFLVVFFILFNCQEQGATVDGQPLKHRPQLKQEET